MTHDGLPDYPFRRARHDRLGNHRDDVAFTERVWRDPATQVLVMHGSEPTTLSTRAGLRWIPPALAPPGERVLLGAVEGVLHVAILAGDEAPSDTDTAGLRDLALTLDEAEAGLAVHAVALANWHRSHRRCSSCGAATEVARAGECRKCPSCGTLHFPRSDPAVIMLVVDADDRALLGHNVARRTTWYSTLAGFVEPGETPEQAVVREVHEEVGIGVTGVRYAGSQPWPFPSSLMLGYFARASSTDVVVDGAEIADARWFSRADVRRLVTSGALVLPTRISIAGALITSWYGEDLPDNQL